MKDLILIVDDIELNRIMLREMLKADYDVVEAENGRETLNYLTHARRLPQIILLDIMMPGLNGFAVLGALRADARTRRIPVLFITAANGHFNESKGLRGGAADYITKPFNPDVVKARVDNQIRLVHYRDHLERLVKERTDELLHVHVKIMQTMATVIEYRNVESGSHIHRTMELMRILVEALLLHPVLGKELAAMEPQAMIKAVVLHDIGKVVIPEHILLKQGNLTEDEFKVIKTHTSVGYRIIQSISDDIDCENAFLRHAQDICRSHHEHWDGTGYPDGLAGEDIPLSARIAAVVDVYDALANPRCYKQPLSHRAAMLHLEREMGHQFDPVIVETAVSIHPQFYRIEASMGEQLATGA